MRVLITGGAGYVGHRLVPTLLRQGYEVIVYDAMYFGHHFKQEDNLKVVQGDIRDIDKLKQYMWGCDAIIHLACISNDPSFELDESLSRTINFASFEPMVICAKGAGVKRFINCSTSSVYGISSSKNVREDHKHVPLTLYNTFKSKCEPILMKYQSEEFTCVTVRPSTICGYSPRMRFDLSVNILTNLAISTGKITVFGGKQLRPNLHIQDMVDCYKLLLTAPIEKIAGETFNVGVQNSSIADLAKLVKAEVQKQFPKKGTIEIETKPIQDERSYHVNSDKIYEILGFKPKLKVVDAVNDLCSAFRLGYFDDSMTNDMYYNVKRMRAVFADLYKDAPAPQVDERKGHMSEIDVMHRGADKK